MLSGYRGGALSPWSEIHNLRREMAEAMDHLGLRAGSGGAMIWAPLANIWEDKDGLVLELELPGVRPEDVSLSMENRTLTISGEKGAETDAEEQRNYHVLERRYGRFERSFAFPGQYDTERVRARFENGVLHVVLPKAETAKPRRIPIEGLSQGQREIEGQRDQEGGSTS
jgi:HSP20 family protein